MMAPKIYTPVYKLLFFICKYLDNIELTSYLSIFIVLSYKVWDLFHWGNFWHWSRRIPRFILFSWRYAWSEAETSSSSSRERERIRKLEGRPYHTNLLEKRWTLKDWMPRRWGSFDIKKIQYEYTGFPVWRKWQGTGMLWSQSRRNHTFVLKYHQFVIHSIEQWNITHG